MSSRSLHRDWKSLNYSKSTQVLLSRTIFLSFFVYYCVLSSFKGVWLSNRGKTSFSLCVGWGTLGRWNSYKETDCSLRWNARNSWRATVWYLLRRELEQVLTDCEALQIDRELTWCQSVLWKISAVLTRLRSSVDSVAKQKVCETEMKLRKKEFCKVL